MSTIRAVRCHDLSGPAGLRVDDIPEPAIGSGEVKIDVRAAGVNFADVLITKGKYQLKPEPPFVPGSECAGVVREIGAGVTSVKPGDRVATTLFHGAFAETVVVPEGSTVKLPDSVSFEVGAATLIAYQTTLHGLADRANLASGETLLVLGAAGGVGIAAVELGKAMGAKVIAVASTDEKLAFCKEHGADAGIRCPGEDLKARVKAVTGGSGVDVVYNPVGGDLAEPALRSLGWGGRYLVIGFASGEIPKVPLNLVLLKSCQIVGVYWGAFTLREPAKNRANGDRIFALVADKKLSPHVDVALPFSRAAEALNRVGDRKVMGKVVLVPG